MVLRKYFNFSSIRARPDLNLKEQTLDAILSDKAILQHWELLTGSVPHKFENYSVELLKAIAELWIHVRGHSFAQGWTMNFETKYKKGTRKALKPQVQN